MKTIEEKIAELKEEAAKYKHLWETNAEESNEIIAELKVESGNFKQGLERIKYHFDGYSDVHRQAKTLKRMASTYLNKVK